MSEQLFITEFDEVYLPTEYRLSHNIAVRLYDDLVWLMKDSKIQKKTNITVKFKDPNLQPKENEKDIVGWLIKNGYKEAADEIISTHLFFGIVSDMCHFIYQALDSAKNVKMTVAYSLIRKPFLENLLIIEQMLIDEKGFLKKFEGHPENFDPGKLNDNEKLKIITECLSKTKSNFILKDEIIYQLRFDKKIPNGLYAITNLATHLVTTRHSNFKTESGNLNFIFSGYDEWDSQLEHFYYFLPYMLLYTTEIVDQYLLTKKYITLKTFKRRKFYRLVGQFLQFDQYDRAAVKGNSFINKLAKRLSVKCENCNKKNQLYKSDLFSLVNNNYLLCKHCLIDLYHYNKSFDEIINKTIK